MSLTQTATVTLVVTADFTLAVSPGSQTVNGWWKHRVRSEHDGSGRVDRHDWPWASRVCRRNATGTFSPASVSAGSSTTLDGGDGQQHSDGELSR